MSLVTIPNVIIFQFGFTVLAPIMDAILLFSIIIFVEALISGIDPVSQGTMILIATYWLIFQIADMAAAIVAIELGHNKRYRALIPLIIAQRFCYRQLLYITAIRALFAALKGTLVNWQKLVRTGAVDPTVFSKSESR